MYTTKFDIQKFIGLLKGKIYVLYGAHNKQFFFTYTASNDCFFFVI
jgi:hypothetical protein